MDQHVSSFPAEQTSILKLSLTFTFLVWFLFVPSCILSALAMPQLRGKPKRDPIWYQNKESMAIHPPPVLTPSPNPHLPLLPSPLRARASFHRCPRPGLVVWSGLISMVIIWAFLLVQSRILPPPHIHPWPTQRTHLRTSSPFHHHPSP
jgi:hypothetical protein